MSLTETIKTATKYKSKKDANNILKKLPQNCFNIYPVCSICNLDYIGYPAISRKDNKTKICSNCGTKEALEDFIKHEKSYQ